MSASQQTQDHSVPELERPRDTGENDNGSLTLSEKDSDEDELDRLVLGDDAGFMAQLGEDMDLDEATEHAVESISVQDEDEEVAMEGVDDADVRSPLDSFAN